MAAAWPPHDFASLHVRTAVSAPLPHAHNPARRALWHVRSVSAFIGSSCGPVLLGPLLHIVGTLSLGGSWADVMGEVRPPQRRPAANHGSAAPRHDAPDPTAVVTALQSPLDPGRRRA
eukprot:2892220-Prymnesium_polylepis.2